MNNKHFETEFVKRHLGFAREALAIGGPQALDRRLSLDVSLDRLESPIEAAFYMWWTAFETHLGAIGHQGKLNLLPQQEVILDHRVFRLDFSVASFSRMTCRADAERFGLSEPRVAVELDGHDFHERTKEQVALRNERDRLLLAAGWTVFHFSGTEINDKQMDCIAEVYVAAEILFSNWEAAVVAHRHPDDPILNQGRK